MHRISNKTQWFIAGIFFVLCIAPTYISYLPYSFRWDDSVYLQDSIAVSRAVWAGNRHGIDRIREIGSAMYGYGIRPPAMTLLGLPWGALRSWDAAGKCFFTLDCGLSLVAVSCIFFLQRIGVKPLFLVLASVCVNAALGPWPPRSEAHSDATALMADSLFAWISLAAVLLIPYEARTENNSTARAVLRGILWGTILSLGAMTKISFLYFVALILPVVLLIRFRRGGLRSSGAALAGFLISSAPSFLYLAKYGRSSMTNGGASSFGALSNFYNIPFRALLFGAQSSPGLLLFAVGVVSALAFIVVKGRFRRLNPDVIALLIATGFEVIVLASPNRELRFSLPFIVSLPFLLAIPMSSGGEPVPRRFAVFTAGIAFLILCAVAWPTRYRARRSDSLARADAVLDQASRCHEKTILMATTSPSLNGTLLRVSTEISEFNCPVQVNEVSWSVLNGAPISNDYREIQEADLVVFQDDRALSPSFLNLRVPSYRSYIAEQKQFVPTRVSGDVLAFSRQCR